MFSLMVPAESKHNEGAPSHRVMFANIRSVQNSSLSHLCAMLRIQWMSSGEDVLYMEAAALRELVGSVTAITVKELKRYLQEQLGQPRFRQRLLSQAGEILADEEKVQPPMTLFLVLVALSIQTSKEKLDWFEAASSCHINNLEGFLLRPSDPNIFCENGQTALHLLAAHGNVDCCRLLLEAKAEINKSTLPSFGVGVAPLHMACVSGHCQVVQLLIQAAADTNRTTTDGDTPLHIAAFNGQLEVVRLLLKAGADKEA